MQPPPRCTGTVLLAVVVRGAGHAAMIAAPYAAAAALFLEASVRARGLGARLALLLVVALAAQAGIVMASILAGARFRAGAGLPIPPNTHLLRVGRTIAIDSLRYGALAVIGALSLVGLLDILAAMHGLDPALVAEAGRWISTSLVVALAALALGAGAAMARATDGSVPSLHHALDRVASRPLLISAAIGLATVLLSLVFAGALVLFAATGAAGFPALVVAKALAALAAMLVLAIAATTLAHAP